jgi:uncharacterized membrane protein YfcA
MTPLLSELDIVIVVVVMAAASFVQSSVGFGLALVSGPVLLLLDPNFVPGPMLATALVNTLLMVRRERQSIDIRGVGYVMIGRVPGTFVAVFVLAALSQRSYDLIFATIIIFSVGLSGLGCRVNPTPRNATIAGFAAGLMGTISSIGGPPLALLYQHATGPTMRSSLAAMFVFGAVISLTALSAMGRFGIEEIKLTGLMIPGVIIGFFASSYGARFVDSGRLRPCVLIVSGLSAIAVVLRTWLIDQ